MAEPTTQPDLNDRKTRLKFKMAVAREELVATLQALTPEQYSLPTENEGWTVFDLASHIAGAEGGMEIIAQRILQGEPAMVEGFDLNRFNAGNIRRRKDKTVADLVEELNQSRARMNQLLEGITDEQLDLPGQHPAVGPIDLYGLFVVIYRHEKQHATEIRKAVGAN